MDCHVELLLSQFGKHFCSCFVLLFDKTIFLILKIGPLNFIITEKFIFSIFCKYKNVICKEETLIPVYNDTQYYA